LCNPGDDALTAWFESRGQTDKGNDRKYIGAPHRANTVRDLDCQPGVESISCSLIDNVGRLDWFVLVLQPLKRVRVRYVDIRRHGHSFFGLTESFHMDIRNFDLRQIQGRSSGPRGNDCPRLLAATVELLIWVTIGREFASAWLKQYCLGISTPFERRQRFANVRWCVRCVGPRIRPGTRRFPRS